MSTPDQTHFTPDQARIKEIREVFTHWRGDFDQDGNPRFPFELTNDVAQIMIDQCDLDAIDNNLDKFKNLDVAIARSLISKADRRGKGIEILALHLDCFAHLTPEIALELIEANIVTDHRTDYSTADWVLDSRESFDGLVFDETLAQTLLRTNHPKTLLRHIEKFEGISADRDLAHLLIERGQADLVIENLPVFQDVQGDPELVAFIRNHGGSKLLEDGWKDFEVIDKLSLGMDLDLRAEFELMILGGPLRDFARQIEAGKPDCVVFLDKSARIFATPLRRHLQTLSGVHIPEFLFFNDEVVKRAHADRNSGQQNVVEEIAKNKFGQLKGKNVYCFDETYATGEGAGAVEEVMRLVGANMTYFALTKSPPKINLGGTKMGTSPELLNIANQLRKEKRLVVYPVFAPQNLFSTEAATLYINEDPESHETIPNQAGNTKKIKTLQDIIFRALKVESLDD